MTYLKWNPKCGKVFTPVIEHFIEVGERPRRCSVCDSVIISAWRYCNTCTYQRSLKRKIKRQSKKEQPQEIKVSNVHSIRVEIDEYIPTDSWRYKKRYYIYGLDDLNQVVDYVVAYDSHTRDSIVKSLRKLYEI